jgi:hypothetical protein
MGTFQDLDGLVWCGCPKKMKEGFAHRFMSSGLGSRFSSFKGRSVTLKRASFNAEQAEMLFLLNRSNVATFNCIESKFSLSPGRCRDRIKVQNLFPKLRSFVFSGPPSLPESFINRAFPETFRFHYLFGDLDLRYFELTKKSEAGRCSNIVEIACTQLVRNDYDGALKVLEILLR